MSGGARHVDQKVVWVWMAPTIIALLTTWLLSSLISLFLPPDFLILGLHKTVFPFVFLLAIAIFSVRPIYGWNYLAFDRFTYELTESDLVVREGVMTRKSSVIPYEKIQDISSERTVFERMLGLATVEIETAGVHHSRSDIVIPGIVDKDDLIAELLSIVELKKSKIKQEEGKPTPEQLLAEILKELKTLSSKIDTLKPKPESKRETLPGADAFRPDAFKSFRKK